MNCLKDKPAFAGITLGETSGHAVGELDRNRTNDPGVSNTRGIYGITDGAGVYQVAKAYSMRKQRVYYQKMMQMVADQLKHRDDVDMSIQINYIRSAIFGGMVATYSKALKVFIRAGHTFRELDAMYLQSGDTAQAAGIQ